jgi:hypothetical protein
MNVHTGEVGANLPIRISAVLLAVHAIGGGLPCLLAIRNLLTGRELPVVLGFKAYGGGPFERIGISTTVPLLTLFLLVCLLEGAAGWLLWEGRRSGALLALALLPAGAWFWWGFALPWPALLALIRTVLIALSWRRLI